jgi:hypothetical protein
MRAITVRQPWAWAIVHGGKDVENRTRNIAGSYRGPVAIHAGLTDDTSDLSAALTCGAWVQWWTEAREAGVDVGQQRGAVIGVVDLIDVHNHEAPRVNSPRHVIPATCPSPWAQDDHHHLVLANPRPLTRPIPWRGALGLWTVPDELEAAIREQVPL